MSLKHPVAEPGASHASPVTVVPVCVRSRYVASLPAVPLQMPVTFAFVVAPPLDVEDVVVPEDDAVLPLEDDGVPPEDDDVEDDEVDDVDEEGASSSPPHATVPERNRTATVV